jgi:hypothetical protein
LALFEIANFIHFTAASNFISSFSPQCEQNFFLSRIKHMTIDFARIPDMMCNNLKHSDQNYIGIYVFPLFFLDWKTSEYEFANGEEFEVPWGRKGGLE